MDGWEEEAVAWLLDAGPAEYRLDALLRAHPRVLARFVVERLAADVEAARRAWVPADRWVARGLPAEAHEPVLAMLAREGPVLRARLHAAELVRDALAGLRWVPRL